MPPIPPPLPPKAPSPTLWPSVMLPFGTARPRSVSITINGIGPTIIVGSMKKLMLMTISLLSLTWYLPKHWHSYLIKIHLLGNRLRILSSITTMENL
ncbi:hypothetical protein NMG60_11012287 [Bertholletia excelsa]